MWEIVEGPYEHDNENANGPTIHTVVLPGFETHVSGYYIQVGHGLHLHYPPFLNMSLYYSTYLRHRFVTLRGNT
jgi:hypothetical protein